MAEYVSKKTRALNGQPKISPERGHLDYQSGATAAKRPTALSIFPHIGMINNKNTYTTKKMEQERSIQALPMGDNDYPANNIMKNDIKMYKNEYIKTKDMLLNRKHKKIKQSGNN